MGYTFIREIVVHLLLTTLSGLVWGCFSILTVMKFRKKKDCKDSSASKVLAMQA